ncbi:MAG: family 10 glycosylhydrolase, partial [Clostridia bacterium]|nr:family 10 glycosylhydrolase [Clostridia bacterium]
LELLIQKAQDCHIRVHGWVNPYRISSGTFKELQSNHPATLLKQKDENSVVEIDTGVYYNPASVWARNLVLAGVKEILENYQVDGIQYDDYFYPTPKESFDKGSYQQYAEGVTYPLSLEQWRRTQVNLLIAGTYQLTRAYEGVAFGVSPAAGIEKNYEDLYADVSAWVQGGYVDYICPQLYFGFSYPLEAFRFDRLLQEWVTLAGETSFYIGLASYKVGQEDAGSTEWVTATDLLARETRFAKEMATIDGICLYHYSSLFQENEQSVKELNHLKEALKDF